MRQSVLRYGLRGLVCCNSSSRSQSALTSLISFFVLRSFAAVSAILRQSGTGREALSVASGLEGDGRSNIVFTSQGKARITLVSALPRGKRQSAPPACLPLVRLREMLVFSESGAGLLLE
jgi:hypothetical protein